MTNSPTIGIVGAGQLARMTYQAAIPLGVRVRVLAERTDEAAALVAAEVDIGSARSRSALAAFAATCDVLTFDHELVDAAALASLEHDGHVVRPASSTVARAQDKMQQRATFAAHGFPVPPHQSIADAAALSAFGDAHGWPVVAKASRGGYDGRGVWVVADQAAGRALVDQLRGTGVTLLAETFVPLERELAVLVARRPGGETMVYPVVETVQRDGICHEVLVPAPVPAGVTSAATTLAQAIAEAVAAVGVLAIELFLVGERLLINEIAARPHNSGHYSIEGCVTSQFEQHARAVLDWPLGSAELVAPAVATVNILGDRHGTDPMRHLPSALAMPGAHVHLYGKQARPGRKLGHVTALATTIEEARTTASTAAARLGGGGASEER